MDTTEITNYTNKVNLKDFYIELLPQFNTTERKETLYRLLKTEHCIFDYDASYEESKRIDALMPLELNAERRLAGNARLNFFGLFEPPTEPIYPLVNWIAGQGLFVFFLEVLCHERSGITNQMRNLLAQYKYDFVHHNFLFKGEAFAANQYHVYKSNIRKFLSGEQLKDSENKLPRKNKMAKLVAILNKTFDTAIKLPNPTLKF